MSKAVRVWKWEFQWILHGKKEFPFISGQVTAYKNIQKNTVAWRIIYYSPFFCLFLKLILCFNILTYCAQVPFKKKQIKCPMFILVLLLLLRVWFGLGCTFFFFFIWLISNVMFSSWLLCKTKIKNTQPIAVNRMGL